MDVNLIIMLALAAISLAPFLLVASFLTPNNRLHSGERACIDEGRLGEAAWLDTDHSTHAAPPEDFNDDPAYPYAGRHSGALASIYMIKRRQGRALPCEASRCGFVEVSLLFYDKVGNCVDVRRTICLN